MLKAIITWAIFLLSVPLTAGEIPWIPVEDLMVDLESVEIVRAQAEQPALSRTVVVLRGVIPHSVLVKQVQKNFVLTTEDAVKASEPIDFVLQRQELSLRASTKETPKWTTLPLEPTLKLLQQCRDFAPDPAPADNLSPTMTIPLPERAKGSWGLETSHPRLLKKGSGLLLFRFLDDQIQPRKVYRYRVKLVYQNPLYERSTPDPFLSRGKTRESSWSVPSPAVRFSELK